MPIDPYINNSIPLNHNIQEDNTQANQIDKFNSNTTISDNNPRNETGQLRDQSNYSTNSKVINSKKRKRKSLTIPKTTKTKTTNVNLAVMKQ